MKIIFEEKARFLLQSANERNTEQGVLICESVLNELANQIDDGSLLELLSKFNKAYIGIEAHGQLTSPEFSAIKNLRELEQSASKNT